MIQEPAGVATANFVALSRYGLSSLSGILPGAEGSGHFAQVASDGRRLSGRDAWLHPKLGGSKHAQIRRVYSPLQGRVNGQSDGSSRVFRTDGSERADLVQMIGKRVGS